MLVRSLIGLFLFAGVAQADPGVASTPHLTPAEEQKLLRLPPGFQAQLVAAEPDILKPMNLAFDTRGRLWVTCSIEYPWASDKPPAKDKLIVLSDFGPDGKARKVVTFADNLNIPIGVLPLPSGNEVIVHSIPNVYLLRDTDGDGKADERKTLLTGIGYRDTHGMVNSFRLGSDGWIYACHGFSNESTVTGSDGRVLKMQSGNTFRFRPDGSMLQAFTHGQVNPFGMTFDPFGGIYSADCHSKPITNLIPGAYYSSFGKPHDGLGYGPDMIGHDHLSTGLCGLTYNSGDHFPASYRDTMFLGNVVTSRINQDRIVLHGASPQAVEQPDFVRSDDPWFRPVDLQVGPDGAIYVADFYNRIIGHYEVPLTHPGRDRDSGRIWRIVYTGKDVTPTPVRSPGFNFATAPIDAVVADLGHPNQSVRMLASHALVAKGLTVAPAVEAPFTKPTNEWQQVQAMWTLERLDRLSDTALDTAIGSPSAAMRTHAMYVLANRSKVETNRLDAAATALRDTDARVSRAAALVLNRHGNWDQATAVILAYLDVPERDNHRKHALRISLRNLAARSPAQFVAMNLDKAPSHVRRTWAEISLGLPIPEAATLLSRLISTTDVDGGRDLFNRCVQHMARFGNPDVIQTLVAHLEKPTVARDTDLLISAVQAIQRGSQERGQGVPDAVRATATKIAQASLDSADTARIQSGLDLANVLKIESTLPTIVNLATDRQRPEPLRLSAITAVGVIGGKNAVDRLAALVTNATESLAIRERSAQSLAAVNTADAHRSLASAIATAPARLSTTIALSLADSPAGGEVLLATIQAGKASGRLVQDRVVAQKLRERKLANLDARIAEVTRGLPSADQKMIERMNQRRVSFQMANKDVNLGKAIYTKNCAICHQLGGEGAKIGPQLDGIGSRGIERLLEDVLDPSRNVDQALRTSTFALTDGRLISGLVLREVGQVVTIADAQGKEVAIAKNTIEERSTSLLSPMPANVSEQIPEAEFYHLLAFLLEQKPKESAVPMPAPRR